MNIEEFKNRKLGGISWEEGGGEIRKGGDEKEGWDGEEHLKLFVVLKYHPYRYISESHE